MFGLLAIARQFMFKILKAYRKPRDFQLTLNQPSPESDTGDSFSLKKNIYIYDWHKKGSHSTSRIHTVSCSVSELCRQTQRPLQPPPLEKEFTSRMSTMVRNIGGEKLGNRNLIKISCKGGRKALNSHQHCLQGLPTWELALGGQARNQTMVLLYGPLLIHALLFFLF